jgi:hypothetical protein
VTGRRGALRTLAASAAVLLVVGLSGVVGLASGSGVASPPTRSVVGPAAQSASPCQFREAHRPVHVALCETFSRPAGIGNRSGELNGTLWGVSRSTGNTNFGQGEYNATLGTTLRECGRKVRVRPDHDVAICHGRVAESVDDQHSVTALAMYPKQPFDIAGRTGTIAFDVSDDSHGNHRAWPEIWYTDQPVPAPFVHFSSLQSVPRNGFGVRFAGSCPPHQLDCRVLCPNEPVRSRVITVDSADVVNDFISDDSFTDVKPGQIKVKQTGCVKASTGPGDLNHFELRVSKHRIVVYGTDAGHPHGRLSRLAVISHMTLTLTRGLVWFEDVHYNGDKDGPDQGTHTFTWDNAGFDGPSLPRDLAFDVADNHQRIGPGLTNLGWYLTKGKPLTLTDRRVTGLAAASGALLVLNYFTYVPVTLQYRINGGAWRTKRWPFPRCVDSQGPTLCGLKTIALPVRLADITSGLNEIHLRSSNEAGISNVDLVLQGAGGQP